MVASDKGLSGTPTLQHWQAYKLEFIIIKPIKPPLQREVIAKAIGGIYIVGATCSRLPIPQSTS